MKTEPRAQFPSQKLNFNKTVKKIQKRGYQSFVVLSDFTVFLCLFPIFFPTLCINEFVSVT